MDICSGGTGETRGWISSGTAPAPSVGPAPRRPSALHSAAALDAERAGQERGAQPRTHLRRKHKAEHPADHAAHNDARPEAAAALGPAGRRGGGGHRPGVSSLSSARRRSGGRGTRSSSPSPLPSPFLPPRVVLRTNPRLPQRVRPKWLLSLGARTSRPGPRRGQRARDAAPRAALSGAPAQLLRAAWRLAAARQLRRGEREGTVSKGGGARSRGSCHAPRHDMRGPHLGTAPARLSRRPWCFERVGRRWGVSGVR